MTMAGQVQETAREESPEPQKTIRQPKDNVVQNTISCPECWRKSILSAEYNSKPMLQRFIECPVNELPWVTGSRLKGNTTWHQYIAALERLKSNDVSVEPRQKTNSFMHDSSKSYSFLSSETANQAQNESPEYALDHLMMTNPGHGSAASIYHLNNFWKEKLVSPRGSATTKPDTGSRYECDSIDNRTASVPDWSSQLGDTSLTPMADAKENEESGTHELDSTYEKLTKVFIAAKSRARAVSFLHMISHATRPLDLKDLEAKMISSIAPLELELNEYADFWEGENKLRLVFMNGDAWTIVTDVSEADKHVASQLPLQQLDAKSKDQSDMSAVPLDNSENAKPDLRDSYKRAQPIAWTKKSAMDTLQLRLRGKRRQIVADLPDARKQFLSVITAAWAAWNDSLILLDADIEDIFKIKWTLNNSKVEPSTLKALKRSGQTTLSIHSSRRDLSWVAERGIPTYLLVTLEDSEAFSPSDSDRRNLVMSGKSSGDFSWSHQSNQGLLFMPSFVFLRLALWECPVIFLHKVHPARSDATPPSGGQYDASGSGRNNSEIGKGHPQGRHQRHGIANEDQRRHADAQDRGRRREEKGGRPPSSLRKPRIPRPRPKMSEKRYRCPICAAGEVGILEVCRIRGFGTVQYMRDVGRVLSMSILKVKASTLTHFSTIFASIIDSQPKICITKLRKATQRMTSGLKHSYRLQPGTRVDPKNRRGNKDTLENPFLALVSGPLSLQTEIFAENDCRLQRSRSTTSGTRGPTAPDYEPSSDRGRQQASIIVPGSRRAYRPKAQKPPDEQQRNIDQPCSKPSHGQPAVKLTTV